MADLADLKISHEEGKKRTRTPPTERERERERESEFWSTVFYLYSSHIECIHPTRIECRFSEV